MSENPLTPTTIPEETPDYLDDYTAMHAANAARRVIETPSAEPSTAESTPNPKSPEEPALTTEEIRTLSPHHGRQVALRVGATAAAGLAAAGVGGFAAHALDKDMPSPEQTTTITLQPGDSLYSIAGDIPGAEKYDQRDIIDSIAADPANIDVLKDGLQPGDSIEIPVDLK